jgi:hypothetical protein
MGVFKDAPVHDWSSHAADAARTLAMGLREARPESIDSILTRPLREPVTMYEGLGNNSAWMGV